MRDGRAIDSLSVALIDDVMLEELHLLIDVAIAGDLATTQLSQAQVDEALGLGA